LQTSRCIHCGAYFPSPGFLRSASLRETGLVSPASAAAPVVMMTRLGRSRVRMEDGPISNKVKVERGPMSSEQTRSSPRDSRCCRQVPPAATPQSACSSLPAIPGTRIVMGLLVWTCSRLLVTLGIMVTMTTQPPLQPCYRRTRLRTLKCLCT